jgi:hypothetical protein
MIRDNTKIEWTFKLKSDIQRINKAIATVRQQVDEGIDRLRLLEDEREKILTNCLGECDGKS